MGTVKGMHTAYIKRLSINEDLKLEKGRGRRGAPLEDLYNLLLRDCYYPRLV